MKKMIFMGAMALAALGLTGCDDGKLDPIDYSQTINVLAVFPNSGSFAERGERYLKTMQMAVADLEKDGTQLIEGRDIRIHVIDATNDKATAKKRTQAEVEKIGADNVVAIMSATGAAHKGSFEVAIDLGIPHVEWASGGRDDEFASMDLSKEMLRPIFQMRGLCPTLAVMAADFAHQAGYKKIGLMRGTKDHDITHTDGIRARVAELQNLGSNPFDGEVTNVEDYVMEYDSEITWEHHLEQFITQNPDIDILFFHLRGDTVNFSFLRAAKTLATRAENPIAMPSLMTCDMARKPALLDPVTTNVADYLSKDDNFFFIGRGPLKTDRADDFDADLTKRYNVTSDRWTKTGYDAMTLVGLAVASTQSTNHEKVVEAMYDNSKGGEKVSYPNIKDAVAKAKAGIDIDLDGVSGIVDIREEGEIINGQAVPRELDRTVQSRYYVENIIPNDMGGFKYNGLTTPEPVIQ